MFTKEQIKEIANRLAAMGKRDSQFPAAVPLKGNETVAIVQDSANRNITVQEFASYILEKEVTLTVRCSTEGSKIWLNNIPQSSVTVKSGELVTIKVTADGYIPLNEVTCVHWDQTIDIVLDKIPDTPVPEPGSNIELVPEVLEFSAEEPLPETLNIIANDSWTLK